MPTADVVLHHFDLHFQCQTFSCYAFVIKIVVFDESGSFASTCTTPTVELLMFLIPRVTLISLSSFMFNSIVDTLFDNFIKCIYLLLASILVNPCMANGVHF